MTICLAHEVSPAVSPAMLTKKNPLGTPASVVQSPASPSKSSKSSKSQLQPCSRVPNVEAKASD